MTASAVCHGRRSSDPPPISPGPASPSITSPRPSLRRDADTGPRCAGTRALLSGQAFRSSHLIDAQPRRSSAIQNLADTLDLIAAQGVASRSSLAAFSRRAISRRRLAGRDPVRERFRPSWRPARRECRAARHVPRLAHPWFAASIRFDDRGRDPRSAGRRRPLCVGLGPGPLCCDRRCPRWQPSTPASSAAPTGASAARALRTGHPAGNDACVGDRSMRHGGRRDADPPVAVRREVGVAEHGFFLNNGMMWFDPRPGRTASIDRGHAR